MYSDVLNEACINISITLLNTRKILVQDIILKWLYKNLL